MNSNKNQLQEYFQKKGLPLPTYETIRSGGPDHKPMWVSSVILHNKEKLKFVGEISPDKTKAENSAAINALNYVNNNFNFAKESLNFSDLGDEIYFKGFKSSEFDVSNLNSFSKKEEAELFEKSFLKLEISSSDFFPKEWKKSELCLENSTQQNKKIGLFVDVENLHKFIDEFNLLILKDINKSNFDPHHNKNFNIYAFICKNHYLADKIFPEYVKKIISPSMQKNGTDTCMQIYIGTLLAKEMYEMYIIATRDNFGNVLTELINSTTTAWICKPAHLIVKPQQLIELL